MSGNQMKILTTLGRDGWEVIAMNNTSDEGYFSTVYLLKRTVG
jgi:hypothetical protein